MMIVKDEDHKDPPNSDFESDLQRAGSGYHIPDNYRRILRTQIQHTLRYHHRRRRSVGVLTVVCTIIFLMAGTEMYLGSDGFNLEHVDSTERDYEVFKSALNNKGIGKVLEVGTDVMDLKREGETVIQKILAKDYVITGVYGFTFRSQDVLSNELRIDVDGEYVNASTGRGKIPAEIFEDYMEFMFSRGDALQAEAEAGRLESIAGEIVDFPEVTIDFKKWRSVEEPWGEVIYWKGVALPDSF